VFSAEFEAKVSPSTLLNDITISAWAKSSPKHPLIGGFKSSFELWKVFRKARRIKETGGYAKAVEEREPAV
jgi:hypothetical protein